jgi:cell division protein FtsQ
MWRKIFILVGSFLLVVFMAVTLSFTARESRNIACRDVQIELKEGDMIRISEDEITRLVYAADKQLIGKELKRINADKIEREIEKHQAIERAEVFKMITADTIGYSGILGVRIRHREPVVRIMSGNEKYYLDESGEKIPVSSSYTANVLVATGDFSEAYARTELLPFVLYLNSNLFWRAQIEQIHIDANGEIVLIPLVGDQVIELGSIKDYQEKLRNLKAFYQQVLANNNWNKYQRISLKYKNQVVAKKR